MFSFFLAGLVVTQAQAPAERLHVEWLAPRGCPSREALASALEANVPANRTFHASVRIDEPRQEGGTWRAVVITTADGSQHTRVVQGPDCERVTAAAVLVVTLAATNVSPPDEPAAPASAELDGGSEDPSPGAAMERGEPRVDEPFSFHIRAQPLVGAQAGVFPFPAVSWGAAFAFMRRRVRVQLALADWTDIQGSSGRGIRGSLTSVALRGCWLFDAGAAVRLGPCTAIEGGRMTVAATGVTAPSTGTVFWSAALAGFTAGYPLTKSIGAWVTAELGLNLVRPRFIVSTLEQDVTLYSVGWVFGRLTLGIEFDLAIP